MCKRGTEISIPMYTDNVGPRSCFQCQGRIHTWANGFYYKTTNEHRDYSKQEIK